MLEKDLRPARIVSVIAATAISLACGTNYAYSAWAPNFASRMELSSTQTNVVGTFGNLGMYAAGIPVGLLVDAKGPRPGVILGGFSMGAGYLALHQAFERGAGSVSVPWLCFFTFVIGVGGAAAFSGSVKTAAVNWPNHRGTATAFPLSSFGLGAFFFTTISVIAFPDNTTQLLVLLSAGTFGLCIISVYFIRLLPHATEYSMIPTGERRESNPLKRSKSKDSRHSAGNPVEESGTQPDSSQKTTDLKDPDESSSLISRDSASVPGDVPNAENHAQNVVAPDSRHIDVRGLAMIRMVEFYQLFFMLGLFTGLGLMTINNIGSNTRALWSHYDDSASAVYIQERQLTQVSILSFMSFCGRLLSGKSTENSVGSSTDFGTGVGSDAIVKKLHASRWWCVFISGIIFCTAEISGARIENPHLLPFLSGMTGLGYGFLFGVYPSLVADTFGVRGLSQNWGSMTLSAIIFGNIFNIAYGRIYDSHVTIMPDGRKECPDGRFCYSEAYWITSGSSFIGLATVLWCIRHEHVKKAKARKAFRVHSREA